MTPLEALVAERVRAGGPVTFAEFMRLALYHPEHGYYAGDVERGGWNGAYVTSPELDPAYGTLWGAFFEQVWDACARPARFDLVEVGPGEGGFSVAVADAATGRFRRCLWLTLVEPSPGRAARQARRLERAARARWAAGIDGLDDVATGCLFANEVLDNQPAHVLERRAGRIAELWVDAGGDGLEPLWGPPSHPALERAADHLAEGARMELSPAAGALVEACARRVVRGAVVFVDYGGERADLDLRARGTLTAYSAGGADDDVLGRPGLRDITAHVDWSAARDAARRAGSLVRGPVAQRELLRALGLRLLDDELARAHADAVADGRGRDALAALSRRHALRALADPAGLGGLGVLVGLKGIAAPPALGATEEGPDRPVPRDARWSDA